MAVTGQGEGPAEHDAQRRERERIEHLVLERPRPPARSVGRGKSKRRIPHELTPEIERVVAMREAQRGRQGTPETLHKAERTRQGGIERLYQKGTIDAVQKASAEQIAAIAERIRAGASVRTMSLETRIDRTPMFDARIRESLAMVQAEMAYSRWRASLGVFTSPLLEMIVEDRGVVIVAKRYRLGVARARRLLIEALDQWLRTLADAQRSVDRRDLDEAHARLN
ncbi:hypothetical protein M9978_02450 [Sphingomonas sp. MG17]|uniref:Uncharacterized protein n=1 Tax=Sphingomonas tagetis TaxID=2949092 RepID=A0A9X2HGT0_9SPHN|nr:hypothetical protein [Sphingomonas tagetis]MCP3729277.1 hypothetical protein [Sphingomonas tagetis]